MSQSLCSGGSQARVPICDLIWARGGSPFHAGGSVSTRANTDLREDRLVAYKGSGCQGLAPPYEAPPAGRDVTCLKETDGKCRKLQQGRAQLGAASLRELLQTGHSMFEVLYKCLVLDEIRHSHVCVATANFRATVRDKKINSCRFTLMPSA
ncbi:hypothetical protein CB1_000444011 [Camelus ferus]|nr:hypothetical protein CB1_000444011 [Camelus ferus]